jgi:4-hydroxybutyrate CoA-transferase
VRAISAAGLPQVLQEDDVVSLLRPGLRVFVQGLASEPPALRRALLAHPSAARGVHWFGALVPGLNQFDYASVAPDARFTGLFIGPHQALTAADGRSELLPLHYSVAYRHFSSQRFDLAIVQVAPPDEENSCSLGVNADFAEAVLPSANKVLAYVNERMPRTAGPAVPLGAFDFVVPTATELLSPTSIDVSDPITDSVARHVAAFVTDGDCLQLGIGKIPAAVLPLLIDRRDLGLHSGLLGDGICLLMESGALTGARKSVDRNEIVTNAVYGIRRLYDLAAHAPFSFRNVAYTHAAGVLARIENLVSINSAVEVDLLGQVNAESVAGRQVSGVGGAVDFARGAALSAGGRSILALPSRANGGRSRIVARLGRQTPVTWGRSDVGIVVTEQGSADLRGLTAPQRAKALIAIAHPSVRDELEREVRQAPC